MKKLFSVIVMMALMPCIVSFASEADSTAVEKPARKCAVEAGLGINMVSSYLWRGSQLDRFAIQSEASISWKGLSASVWGSTGLLDGLSSREIDLSLSYEIKGFSICFTDYYCPASEEMLFFTKAPHTLEVGVGYDILGYVTLNWYTNVFNDDNWSSYFEIGVPFTIAGVDCAAAVGCSPYHSEYYGTEHFNVINCSLSAGYEFELKKCTIPIGVQLMANPATKAAYFCCSAGISF